MRLHYVFILALICSQHLRAQLPHADIDILHYHFELELSDQKDQIKGKANINIRFLKKSDAISLNLYAKGNKDKGMIVDKVFWKDKEISYNHTGRELLLNLERAIEAEETVELNIHYHGIPADGLIISQNKYGDRTFFADNWPNRAHHWLPTIDHPSDKATCEFVVRAPNHYKVVANGMLQEESDLPNDMCLTHWRTFVPISTKVMVIGVSRFAVQHLESLEDVPISSWVFPQNRQEGFYDYAPAREVLQLMQSLIGEYPYSKLANVQSKTRYGGMENAGTIFYSESSIKGERSINRLLAHEIAHQWFGNSVAELDWPHIWLSEGFASYLAHVYTEKTEGHTRMLEGLAGDKSLIFSYYKQNPQAPLVNYTITDINKYLNTNSYKKGAWVLHMLRNKLGDAVFWEGIRAYTQKYAHSNATTGDLQKVMEISSGKDLSSFFQQWCYEASYPILDIQWEYDTEEKVIILEVHQKQKGVAFNLELPIKIYPSQKDSHQTEILKITQTHQRVEIPSSIKPNKIEAILDNLLAEAHVLE